jgi:hypothetical protein
VTFERRSHLEISSETLLAAVANFSGSVALWKRGPALAAFT